MKSGSDLDLHRLGPEATQPSSRLPARAAAFACSGLRSVARGVGEAHAPVTLPAERPHTGLRRPRPPCSTSRGVQPGAWRPCFLGPSGHRPPGL